MPILDFLLDLLYPPKCPFCGTLLERDDLLCQDCERDLPWLTGAAGERAVELTEGCVSALRYEGRVRKAVHGYKFSGKSARSKTFGILVAQAIQDYELAFDVITWPSLSNKRLRKRGYDQAELLARTVGEYLHVPVIRTLDKEERPAQSGLEDEGARKVNLLGAYQAVNVESFRGKRVLLVDDVVTTGATLTECAKTLQVAGAKCVICATLANAGKCGGKK